MRPSFFGYGNDKDLKVCFLVTRIICLLQQKVKVGDGINTEVAVSGNIPSKDTTSGKWKTIVHLEEII